MVNSYQRYHLHLLILGSTSPCGWTVTHRHLHWVSQWALHHCQQEPGALWLVAGWWMSLPWASLLKCSSIRLQPHRPHIWLDPNGSQLLPVITHRAWGRDAMETAIGAQSLTPDALRKPFQSKERILCDSCSTPSQVTAAARGWRGEIGIWRGILMKSRMLFPFFMRNVQSENLI